MTLSSFFKIPDFFSTDTDEKRKKIKLQIPAEFKLWFKDTMKITYAKEENTLSLPTRSVDSSKTPHRLSLLLEAQHGHNLWLCFC